MPQFLTELRDRYNGGRWLGPTIEAPSMEEAQILMLDSPYEIVGQLVHAERLPDGDIQKFVVPVRMH